MLFQDVNMYRGKDMPVNSDSIISQTWKKLLFLNFSVPKDQITTALPSYLKPDEFKGECFVSIVPFEMSNVKFSFTPTLPFSTLNELNLRTYVDYNGTKGIYFFTLDSNHRIGNFIAKTFFNLPYRFSKIKLELSGDSFSCESDSIKLNARIGNSKSKGSFEYFISERYSLFTNDSKNVYEGQVTHKPWDFFEIQDLQFFETLNKKYSLKNTSFVNSFYSHELDVSFRKFKIVGKV